MLYETTLIDQVDHRALVSRVKSKGVDVVFAAYFGTNFGVVLNQLKEQKVEAPILGVYETEDSSVIEVAGANADGVLFFVPEPRQASWIREQFINRYREEYGYLPPVLASNAYDSTILLVRSLSACGLNVSCAQQTVRATRDYPGVSGTFSIGSDGGAQKDFVLKHIENQVFKRREQTVR